MNDHYDDTDEAAATSSPNPLEAAASSFALDQAATQFLDISTMLDCAKRAERTTVLCLRADLEDEYEQAIERIAELTTESDESDSQDETSLGEQAEVNRLTAKALALRDEMRANSAKVTFRAMDSDEWETFDKSFQRDARGNVKDVRGYNDALMIECAIQPTLDKAALAKMRKSFSVSQMARLASDAFLCNASGGIDVPKLPTFLGNHQQRES